MKCVLSSILRVLAGLITLPGTGGIRAVLAENFLLKRQVLVLRRSRRGAPNLCTADRWLFGFYSQFLNPRRLIRAAINLKPATLLRFHRGFKDLKYRFFYSSRREIILRRNWQIAPLQKPHDGIVISEFRPVA